MHPLDGVLAKVNRARDQIKSLNDTITAVIEGYSYGVVVAERDRDPSYRVLRLRADQEGFPLEWSVIIGEIAHDLRSALDLLACQLALVKSPGTPSICEQVSFPIVLRGPASKRTRSKEGRWGPSTGIYFKRKHRAAIKRLQPYHRGNGYRLSPLWLLRELNNADKHRFILLAGLTTNRISLRRIKLTRPADDIYYSPVIRSIDVKQRVPLIERAKVGRIGTDSKQGVEVESGAMAAKVFFSDGCDAVKGFEVIAVLVSAFDAVVEATRLFYGEI